MSKRSFGQSFSGPTANNMQININLQQQQAVGIPPPVRRPPPVQFSAVQVKEQQQQNLFDLISQISQIEHFVATHYLPPEAKDALEVCRNSLQMIDLSQPAVKRSPVKPKLAHVEPTDSLTMGKNDKFMMDVVNQLMPAYRRLITITPGVLKELPGGSARGDMGVEKFNIYIYGFFANFPAPAGQSWKEQMKADTRIKITCLDGQFEIIPDFFEMERENTNDLVIRVSYHKTPYWDSKRKNTHGATRSLKKPECTTKDVINEVQGLLEVKLPGVYFSQQILAFKNNFNTGLSIFKPDGADVNVPRVKFLQNVCDSLRQTNFALVPPCFVPIVHQNCLLPFEQKVEQAVEEPPKVERIPESADPSSPFLNPNDPVFTDQLNMADCAQWGLSNTAQVQSPADFFDFVEMESASHSEPSLKKQKSNNSQPAELKQMAPRTREYVALDPCLEDESAFQYIY